MVSDSPEASADPGPVPTASIQGPLVYPLTSCCKTGATSKTLGCLVRGYFPEPVTVTWDTGSLNSSTLTFPAVQDSSSSLYTVTSQVTILGEWTNQKLTCSVAHAANTTIRTITGCTKNFTDPSLRFFYSSCDPHGDAQATIHLRCYISGYTPGKVKVTWLVDGQEDRNLFSYTAPDQLEGKLASTYSEVNITQGQWASQITYTCQVSYYGFIYEKHALRCTAESEPRGVSAYLSPPTPLDLYVHKSPKLTCLVVDLASSENVNLLWSRENKGGVILPPPGPPVIKPQFNGTFSATSTLPVNVSDWIEGETYYCNVTHPDLPKPILRSISKGPGKRVTPEVYVLWSPDELKKGRLTLTCLIQNFFPADISVLWLRNDAPVQADRHSTTRPHKASDSLPSFFVYSRLVVSQSDWEQNKFACEVIHEALPGSRTLQKEVSKNPGPAQPVPAELALEDLCAEEAESQELEAMWTGLLVFTTLFLLSVSYGAAITLCKVGTQTALLPGGAPRDRESPLPGRRALTSTLPQVKWVLAAILQEQPPASHDYTNVQEPAA
uniref:Ig-like domain-containing protein n=1 Tax=Sus scrofa TaxID=9823 RepID=A0A8D1L5X5_PIG